LTCEYIIYIYIYVSLFRFLHAFCSFAERRAGYLAFEGAGRFRFFIINHARFDVFSVSNPRPPAAEPRIRTAELTTIYHRTVGFAFYYCCVYTYTLYRFQRLKLCINIYGGVRRKTCTRRFGNFERARSFF